MDQRKTTAHFDFALEFPQNWQPCLQKIKREGFSAVSSNIYWGLHESSPGMCDFSKSSKLKVEKFLQVAASVGLQVDLIFGFMPSRHTFPDWVKSASHHKALVPALVWDGISGPYFLNEVPSLEDTQVSYSFLSFLEEAMTFLPLYKEPEGALRNVFFDAGIFECNQSITDDSSFSRWLEEEYASIDVLNGKYQTAFNHFSSAGSKTGFRVLLDKRPWLAAFDYKSARNAYLTSFREKIKHTSSEVLISMKENVSEDVPSPWTVSFDSVFVEGNEQLFPFSPESLVLPQSVLGFRFLQSMRENFKEWDFTAIPLWKTGTPKAVKNSVVINGKYLSRNGVEWIRSCLASGSQFVFPFGVPQFDEEMKPSRCLENTQRDTVQIADNRRLQIYRFGSGRLAIPDPLCAFGSSFQPDLAEIVSSLDANWSQI